MERHVKKARQSGFKIVTPRKKKLRKKTKCLDEFDKCFPKRKFLEYWVTKREIPTPRKLYNWVKEEPYINFTGKRNTFCRIMKDVKCRLK